MELCTKYGYEQKFYRFLCGYACICNYAGYMRRVLDKGHCFFVCADRQ